MRARTSEFSNAKSIGFSPQKTAGFKARAIRNSVAVARNTLSIPTSSRRAERTNAASSRRRSHAIAAATEIIVSPIVRAVTAVFAVSPIEQNSQAR